MRAVGTARRLARLIIAITSPTGSAAGRKQYLAVTIIILITRARLIRVPTHQFLHILLPLYILCGDSVGRHYIYIFIFIFYTRVGARRGTTDVKNDRHDNCITAYIIIITNIIIIIICIYNIYNVVDARR